MDRDAPAPRNILRSIISEEAPNAIIHHDPSSTAVRKYKFTTILARLTSRLWNGWHRRWQCKQWSRFRTWRLRLSEEALISRATPADQCVEGGTLACILDRITQTCTQMKRPFPQSRIHPAKVSGLFDFIVF